MKFQNMLEFYSKIYDFIENPAKKGNLIFILISLFAQMINKGECHELLAFSQESYNYTEDLFAKPSTKFWNQPEST